MSRSYDFACQLMRSLLMEEASQQYVVDAIKKKYEVDITYDDGATGERRIEPVAYGKSTAGNMVLRAYQVGGDTSTSEPGWKLFRLDRIMSWVPDKDSNFGKPPAFDSNAPYNENGDETMSEVYVIADFGQGGEITDTAQVTEPEVSVNTPSVKPSRTSNIAGFDSSGQDVSDVSSKQDMSSVKGFGDTSTTQTTGPVTKDNVENDNVPVETNVNYSNVQNGPVYKQEPKDIDSLVNGINFVGDKEEEGPEGEENNNNLEK